IQPEGMAGEFYKFPYPVDQVTGTVEYELTSDRHRTVTVNVEGKAKGRPVRLMGRIDGAKSREAVELDLWVDRLALDDHVLRALPARSRALAVQFNLAGQA